MRDPIENALRSYRLSELDEAYVTGDPIEQFLLETKSHRFSESQFCTISDDFED